MSIKNKLCASMILHSFSLRSSMIHLLYSKKLVIANYNDKCEFLNQVLFPYTNCLNIYGWASHQTPAYRLSAIHRIEKKKRKKKSWCTKWHTSPSLLLLCFWKENTVTQHHWSSRVNIKEWNQYLCGCVRNMCVVSLACLFVHLK